MSLQIKLATRFPDEVPEVSCSTEVLHPNIDPTGDTANVCLSLLDEWESSFGLEDCVQGLLFLLYEPNQEDPLSPYFCGDMSENFYREVRISLTGRTHNGFTGPRLIEDDDEIRQFLEAIQEEEDARIQAEEEAARKKAEEDALKEAEEVKEENQEEQAVASTSETAENNTTETLDSDTQNSQADSSAVDNPPMEGPINIPQQQTEAVCVPDANSVETKSANIDTCQTCDTEQTEVALIEAKAASQNHADCSNVAEEMSHNNEDDINKCTTKDDAPAPEDTSINEGVETLTTSTSADDNTISVTAPASCDGSESTKNASTTDCTTPMPLTESAPTATTSVVDDTPVESTSVTGDTPTTSTSVTDNTPTASTSVTDNTPTASASASVTDDAPVESTSVTDDTPTTSTFVTDDTTTASTSVTDNTPTASASVTDDAPVESTAVTCDYPTTSVTDSTPTASTPNGDNTSVESTSVTDNTPVESTCVTDDTPNASTSVTDSTPIASTSVTDNTSVESTSVTDNTPVESTSVTDNTSVASTSVTDTTTIASTSSSTTSTTASVIDNVPTPSVSVTDSTTNIPTVSASVEDNTSTASASVTDNTPITSSAVIDSTSSTSATDSTTPTSTSAVDSAPSTSTPNTDSTDAVPSSTEAKSCDEVSNQEITTTQESSEALENKVDMEVMLKRVQELMNLDPKFEDPNCDNDEEEEEECNDEDEEEQQLDEQEEEEQESQQANETDAQNNTINAAASADLPSSSNLSLSRQVSKAERIETDDVPRFADKGTQTCQDPADQESLGSYLTGFKTCSFVAPDYDNALMYVGATCLYALHRFAK